MSIRFTIGLKVFVTFMVIALGISWYLVEETPEALAKEIDKAAEEVMVDTANLLSQVVTFDIKEDKINIDKLSNIIETYLKRKPNAKIYDVEKSSPTYRLVES